MRVKRRYCQLLSKFVLDGKTGFGIGIYFSIWCGLGFLIMLNYWHYLPFVRFFLKYCLGNGNDRFGILALLLGSWFVKCSCTTTCGLLPLPHKMDRDQTLPAALLVGLIAAK